MLYVTLPLLCVLSFLVYSTISTMFTLQHYFSVIPHETAVHRSATSAERIAGYDVCREPVTTSLGAALKVVPEEPAIRCRPGRPPRSLNVEI